MMLGLGTVAPPPSGIEAAGRFVAGCFSPTKIREVGGHVGAGGDWIGFVPCVPVWLAAGWLAWSLLRRPA